MRKLNVENKTSISTLGFEVKLKVKKFGQTVFDVMYIEFSMNCIFSDSCPRGRLLVEDAPVHLASHHLTKRGYFNLIEPYLT